MYVRLSAYMSIIIGIYMISGCSTAPKQQLGATSTSTGLIEATATAVVTATREATATAVVTATREASATAVASENGVVITQLKLEATSSPETLYKYVFPIANAKVSYGKAHHDYPATDIFCDDGSEFVAVIDGVIDAVVSEDLWDSKVDDPASRSGIAIAIIGVDGNRYYGSHLSKIADGITVGMQVTAGQVLGYTGHSGNARYTPPHLHFGISRPTTPDDWQVRRGEMNPYRFLKSWEQGIPLQPLFIP